MYEGNKKIETVDKEFKNNIQKKDNKASYIRDSLESDADQISGSHGENEHRKKYDQGFDYHKIVHHSESPHNSSSSVDENEESSNNATSTNIRVAVTKFEHYLKEMIAKYNIPYKIPITVNNSIIIITPKGFKEKITMNEFHGYKNIRGSIFCQLCKTWVDKNTSHISSANHAMNILQPIDDNFIRKIIIDSKWSHCLICNDMVIPGPEHTTVNPNHWKYCYGKTHTTVEVPKKHKRKKQHEKSSKDLYCKVCQIYLAKERLMAIHKKGKKHLNKSSMENRALIQLNIELKNLDLNQVSPSDSHAVSMPSTSTAAFAGKHLPQDEELTIEEKTFEFMQQMSDYDDVNFECMICEVKVHKYHEHIIEHVESREHKMALNSLLNEHKIVQKSMKLYHCEFCESDISDFVSHINENIDHMIKVILHSKIDKNELRRYVYKQPLNDEPLVHAYKEVHKKLLRENKIERLSGSSFYCNICHLTLYANSEINHMLGQWHRSTFADIFC